MQKFHETLTKYKNEEILNLLLISSENLIHASKLKEELRNVNCRLEKMGSNNYLSNMNFSRNIVETIFSVNNEIRTIENQNVIMNFLENFYTHLLYKIKNKFAKINENYNNYKNKKGELDFSFIRNLEDFKKIFEKLSNEENSQNLQSDNFKEQCKEIEIKAIEKSFVEFKKLFSIFEEKLKNFNSSLNNFTENHARFKEKNSFTQTKLDDRILKEQITMIKLSYNEIIKNLESNNFKEILTRIENHWNKNNLKTENFNEISKLKKLNSTKIKSMLDDQCGRLKKALLDKLSELNLLNKNIENNLEIAELPKIIQNEISQLQEEIKKRKEFEFVFTRMMNYLNQNLLAEEEKRRNEFYQKMTQYSKNEIYKKVFNKFCEHYNEETNRTASESLEEINSIMNRIENDLNQVRNKIYYDVDLKERENFTKGNLNCNSRKNSNLITEDNPQHKKSALNKYNQEILSNHLENLNVIQKELTEILKENFKSREDKKEDCELSRRNSEIVLVDKDELTDFTKKSPVIHLNTEEVKEDKFETKKITFQTTGGQEMIEMIELKLKNILNDLRKINEFTKLPDNSINLDISNTSLINSIYLSNLILNEKNTNSAVPHNINYNHIECNLKSYSNKNYSEVERFVMLYEDKIYFFDTLYEYMNNFIKSKNINFTLTRQPMSLGRLIESILRNWLKTKSKFVKYKNKIKKIVIK